MSRGVNKVILVGRLGKDPETRYGQSGSVVCNLSIATSEQWKDKNTGEQKEKTEWHNLVFFGRQAEICGEYLKKGSMIYVEGKLRTEKWQDKDGNDRYTTKVYGHEMQMLGGGNQSAGNDDQQSSRPQQQDQPASQPAPAPAAQGGFDDDIPF